MPTRIIRLTVILVGLAAPALAEEAPGGLGDPVFLVGAQYGAPCRLAATAGVLLGPPRPFRPADASDSSRVGLVLAGSAGTGGFRVAAGAAALALEGPFLTTGLDALFTVSRTTHTPRGAAGESTYVGAEAGVVIMSVRLSAGVAHRVAGHAGQATIFTWNVGVQLPLGW